jgi:hypothetical protein
VFPIADHVTGLTGSAAEAPSVEPGIKERLFVEWIEGGR